jgi:hypothetical protein
MKIEDQKIIKSLPIRALEQGFQALILSTINLKNAVD